MDELRELTPDEVWQFRHVGFLRVEDRLDADTLAALRAATERNVQGLIEPLEMERCPEWEDAASWNLPEHVRRLSKILDRDPIYLDVASSPAITDVLADLLGPNIELITNRHNHLMVRPAGSDYVYWHRDSVVGQPFITALIYLDDSTYENGALQVVPGSHLPAIRRQDHFRGEAFQADPLFRQRVTMPVRAGGLLLTDFHLLHGAEANRSRGSRRSMTLAYKGVDELGSANPPNRVLVRGERVYRGHPGEQS